MTDREVIAAIRQAHALARPTPSNLAWLNCHNDRAVLLAALDKQEKQIHKLLRIVAVGQESLLKAVRIIEEQQRALQSRTVYYFPGLKKGS